MLQFRDHSTRNLTKEGVYAGTYIQFYFTEEGVVAGTYIPPGPMLNSASTRLACLEDVEVDVSAPGAPQHLFRRRVFAPEDNRDERYLTASDVVKVRLFSSAFFCQPCFVVRLFLFQAFSGFVPETAVPKKD